MESEAKEVRPVDETPEDETANPEPAFELDATELQHRLWLRAIMPILTMNADGTEAEDHPRVQHAWSNLKIAACERVCRILRSDLPEDKA